MSTVADDRNWFAEFPRSQTEILGKDRAQLLHGLCTNDIKKLSPGGGCEAFLTNVQGKTIGYVYVFCSPESLILDSVAGAAPEIIRNLDRYVVREDVRFVDRSQEWAELLCTGPTLRESLIAILGTDLPEGLYEHRQIPYSEKMLSIRRTPFVVGDCYQLSGERDSIAQLAAKLRSAGIAERASAEIEPLRIEAGTPLFGVDITADNLPQEVDRNELAISFTKGCYLGQETVARIDALGHVNRLLRGFRFDGREVPNAGSELSIDGKVIAKITSAAFSPRLNCPIALGYVRRGHHQRGTKLPSSWGNAELVEFR